MKLDNVGFDENQWKGKTFEEFKKFATGKLRSDRIKVAFDMLPKVPKPKKPEKVKEDK